MNTCRCPGMEVTPPPKKGKKFSLQESVRNWIAHIAHSIGMCILIISIFVKKNMTTKHVTDEYTN